MELNFVGVAYPYSCVNHGGCAITVLIPKLESAKLYNHSHVPKPFCLFSYRCDKVEK
nr:MAG TPA: hypothetical protein [Caudoviricetes sp.]